MHQIDVYTIALSKWRVAKSKDIPIFDITYKSGNKAFAPDGKALGDRKAGLLTEDEYTKLYINKMRSSFVLNNSEWKKLLLVDKIALACYCKAGSFCHRHLLKELLVKYFESEGIKVTLKGELE